MENLIVEEPGGTCTINKIINALKSSQSFSVLRSNWSSVARYLDTPPMRLIELQDHFHYRNFSIEDILQRLILNWKGRCGREAKIKFLLEALDRSGLRDLAETLENEFGGSLGQVRIPSRKRNEPSSSSTSSENVTSSQKQPRTQKFSFPPRAISEFLQSEEKLLIICTTDVSLTREKVTQTVPDVVENEFEDLINLDGGDRIPLLALQPPNTEIDWELILDLQTKVIVITGATQVNVRLELLSFMEDMSSEQVRIIDDVTSWNDLTPQFRLKLKTKLMEELELSKFPNLKYAKNELIRDLVQEKTPHLWKDTILSDLKYYVSRTLVTRNIILRDDVCTEVKFQDIFVIQGVEWHQLSALTKGKGADSSQRQLEKVTVTSNFISLDHSSHFERICSRANRPVHLMALNEDNNFIWIRTKGEIDFVQKHVKRSYQRRLDEVEFIREIVNKNSGVPIILSDTPGMGKSVLLGKIGRELERAYQNRKIIFLVISEFIHLVKDNFKGSPDKTQEIFKVLCNMSCENELGQAVLEKKLHSENELTIELLFDGFDEILGNDQKDALDVLKTIMTIPSIRLWVTTRPHLLLTLEKELNVLGYNIAPFTEPNQIKFFTQYWSQIKAGLDLERLEKFSMECLKNLRDKINETSKQEDIAGIPLQCLLIGEVFAEDAIGYAEYEFNEPCIRISSITDLYKFLVDKKFQTYFSRYNKSSTLNKEALTKIMTALSIKLLLPQVTQQFDLNQGNQLTLEEILNVGILLERSTFDAPRFIHRTFAEYFVAVYLKENANHPDRCQYNQILFEAMDVNLDNYSSIRSEEFYHPVVVYLLDILLEEQHDLKPEIPWSFEFDSRIDAIGRMCLKSDAYKVFKFLGAVDWIGEQFRAIFSWKDDVVTCIKICRLEFVKNACELFEILTGSTLKSLMLDEKFGVNGEPLLQAIKRGDRTIVEYLLDHHGFDEFLKEGQGHNVFSEILTECVTDSMEDSDRIIEDKIQIIRKIVHEDLGVLRRTEKPILYNSNAHFKLLVEIVRLMEEKSVFGNCETDWKLLTKMSSNWDHNTVLEYLYSLKRILPATSFEQLFSCHNMTSPFLLFLHVSILKSHDYEVWTMAKEHHADFNATDSYGEPVLFMAIRQRCEVDFLKRLVDMGADPFFSNNGMTAMHKAAMYSNKNVIGFLLELGLDINAKCERGKTPLDYCLGSSGPHFDMGKFLIDRGATFGSTKTPSELLLTVCLEKRFPPVQTLLEFFEADISSQDNDGNSPLHLWMKGYDNWSFVEPIEYLIRKGADVNARNKAGQTPFSAYANFEEIEPNEFLILLFAQSLEKNEIYVAQLQSMIWKLLGITKEPDLETLRSILQRFKELGGDLNNRNDEGDAWSHRVVQEGWFKHLRVFIDLGADMNVRNSDKNSVLHSLLAHETYDSDYVSEVAEYMINQGGVDLKALNDIGETPFLSGLKKESLHPIKPSLVRLFEAKGLFDGEEVARHALTWAIILDEKEMTDEEFERIVRKCESVGASLFEVDKDDGWTLLHSAAYVKIHRSVNYLIHRGLDVNAKNNDGDTPLNLALSEHFNFRDPLNVMITLLKHGAGVFLENNEGISPMDNVTGHPHCFNYFLKSVLLNADELKLRRLVTSSLRFGNLNSIKLACKYFRDNAGKTLLENAMDGREKESYLHNAIDRYNFEAFKYLVHLQGLKKELLSWGSFRWPRIPASETKEEDALDNIKTYCLHHKPILKFPDEKVDST